MKAIKIVQYYVPPYAYGCSVKSLFTTCEDPGLEVLLLYLKLKTLGYDPELVTVKDRAEMLNAVVNETADITGTTLPLTVDNFKQLTATNSLLEEKALFIVKSMQIESQNLLFSMCDWRVWLLCLVLFLAVYGMRRTVGKFRSSEYKFAFRVEELQYALWGIAFTVVFYTYTSFLAIIFSQKIASPLPFKTLAALSEKIVNKECKLFVNRSMVDEYMHLMPSGDYLYFANAVNESQVQIEPNETKLVERIAQSECNVAIVYRSERYVYEYLSCELEFVDLKEMPTFSYVFYVRHNFPHKNILESIDAATDWYDRYLKKYAKSKGHRQTCYNSKSGSTFQPLTLRQLLDCFSLLCGGVGLAGLLLLVKSFHRSRLMSKTSGPGISPCVRPPLSSKNGSYLP